MRRAAAIPWLWVVVAALAWEMPASAEPGQDAWQGVPRLSAGERERLERGESVTRMIPMAGKNQRAGLAVRVVPRDAERVFRAVADVGHWSDWVPFLDSSARSEVPGTPARELGFDLPWPLRDRSYRAKFRVETSRATDGSAREWIVSWLSIPDSGNVEWARGSFLVREEGPAETLVVFRSATDLGEPRFARALLDRMMEDSLHWVLDGLAQQVNRCRYTAPFPAGCLEDPPTVP